MATSDLLIRLRADVGQADRALGGIVGTLGKLSSSRGFQLGALGGGLGVTAILGKATQASMQFNDSFADVIRTVNDADKVGGFDNLRTGILELSKTIPITATELANIASQGGQMNVPADQLLDFTRVVAEMGKGTALSTDQAAEGLGKLANVTGEHNWERLASEIVAVGNVNVGGVGQLLDVSQRIALVGHQIGLGVPEILAIGGAIGDAGIEAEMGGSAVSRIFLEMQQAVSSASRGIVTNTKDVRDAMQKVGDIGDDIGLAEQQRSEMFTKRGRLKKGVSKSSLMAADLRISRLRREQGDASSDLTDLQHPGANKLTAFAEMANMSSDQFGAEFKMSPFNAFGDVLRGLNGRSSDEQQRLLDKAGINNIRDIETLAGLAGNPGHVAELLGAAQDQAGNPSALGAVAATKFSSTASQQQIVGNEVTAGLIALGDKVAPQMLDAERSAISMAEHISSSTGLFDTMLGHLDTILPGLIAISGLNAMGGLGMLGSLLKFGGGAAGAAGGAASGAAGAVGGTFGGGLAAIIAATLGTGFMADHVADMAKAAGAPDVVSEALRNFGPPGAAAGAQGIKQIVVDVGGIQTGGGLSWDDVKAGLEAAWNRAVAAEPVTRQLGGAYTP